MYKEYGIYKLYMRVGEADVEVIDLIDNNIMYRSINNRGIMSIEEMSSKILMAIDEYTEKDAPYLIAEPPIGYGL